MNDPQHHVEVVLCHKMIRKAYINHKGEEVMPEYCGRAVLLKPGIVPGYLSGTCYRCGHRRIEKI